MKFRPFISPFSSNLKRASEAYFRSLLCQNRMSYLKRGGSTFVEAGNAAEAQSSTFSAIAKAFANAKERKRSRIGARGRRYQSSDS